MGTRAAKLAVDELCDAELTAKWVSGRSERGQVIYLKLM
jgi:hypothetical protein